MMYNFCHGYIHTYLTIDYSLIVNFIVIIIIGILRIQLFNHDFCIMETKIYYSLVFHHYEMIYI